LKNENAHARVCTPKLALDTRHNRSAESNIRIALVKLLHAHSTAPVTVAFGYRHSEPKRSG